MTVPYDTLQTVTRNQIIPEVIDQLPTTSILLDRLMKRKKTLTGEYVEQPVQYQYSSTGGAWNGGYNELDLEGQEFLTKAKHPWSHYQQPVVWAETDLMKNMGESQIIDYAEALAEAALKGLRETFGRDLFKDGSLNAKNARTVDGLSAVITRNGNPSVGSYGQISRSSSTGTRSSYTNNAWWNGMSFAVNEGAFQTWTGSFNISNSSTVLDLRKMNQMYIMLPEPPDIYITSLALFGRLWDLIQANERIKGGEETGVAGFKFIMINGTPCVADTLIDNENKVYALNFKYFFMRLGKGGDFAQSGPRTPTRMRVVGRFIWIDGNLTCSRPNCQGVMTSATAQ